MLKNKKYILNLFFSSFIIMILVGPIFAIGAIEGGDSGSGELDVELSNTTRIYNITLADNLDGNIQSGGSPISVMRSVPMIQCQKGTKLSCEYVNFCEK